ncbi:MAG: type I addiction module toxin, SymE family [Ignavibacteriae bacterium]|nr:type I addiction module toxin, SymE family [Ignavibacteriota bacterium]
MITFRKTSYLTYPNKSVPYIRLSGKWLEKLGFKIGSSFKIVKLEDKLLLIPSESTNLNN